MSENKFKTIAKIRRSWIYEGKMKSSSLSYNRRETRDKRPLGRDPDRSCCHLHTSVKLFYRSPWFHRYRRQHTGVLQFSPWIHGLRPRKLYTSVEMTTAPVPVRTQRPLFPRLGRELFTLPM